MKEKVFINLSAGLYYSSIDFENMNVVHLQSSLIESKNFNRFVYSVPDDILFNLAIGNKVTIIDCSSNPVGSKVIRIGIPILKFILNRRWFNRLENGNNRLDKRWVFRISNSMKKYVKNKIDYYKDFLLTDTINLEGINYYIEKEDKNYVINEFLKKLENNK